VVLLGAEQGAAQRLPDRGLVRRQVTRPGQRNRGLMVMPGLQQLGAPGEQLVDVFHGPEFRPGRGGSETVGGGAAPTAPAAFRAVRGPTPGAPGARAAGRWRASADRRRTG